jgi:hypothetical protein
MPESRPTAPLAPAATQLGASAPEVSPDELARKPRPKAFQFSMRTLLIATTVVAVVSALAPNSFVARVLFYLLLDFAPLVCFVTAAVYARGTWQTFALGAACAALINAHNSQAFSALGSVQILMSIAWVYFLYAVGGGLAILTRRVVEGRGWRLPLEPGDNNPAI